MITGEKNKKEQFSEREYRKLDFLSQSSLKEYVDDRKKFFKKYILKEDIKDADDENQAMIMGTLVEIILWSAHEFDKKYIMSSATAPKDGTSDSKFCNELYKITMEELGEDGKLPPHATFRYLSEIAFRNASIGKPKYETYIKDFVGSSAEEYYNEILAARPKGLTVLSARDVENADNIVSELRSNAFTGEIVNAETTKDMEVHNGYSLTDFDIKGIKFKGLIDRLHIDHHHGTIQPYDLKCTWNVEEFYEKYFLFRKSYLQAAMYDRGLRELIEFKDYVILPMKFIVCDSINYMKPLIYQMDLDSLRAAYEGFTHKDKYYPGLMEIIEDLNWHLDGNDWGITRKNYLNQGRITI